MLPATSWFFAHAYDGEVRGCIKGLISAATLCGGCVFSAIDQGRNQLPATRCMTAFRTDVDRFGHRLRGRFVMDAPAATQPAHCWRTLSEPGSPRWRANCCPRRRKSVRRGRGLLEVKYLAAGFMHVRREVLEAIRDRLKLPYCNTRFSSAAWWPFFQPCTVEDAITIESEGSNVEPITVLHRYLTDDFVVLLARSRSWVQDTVDTSDSAVAQRPLWLRVGRGGAGCRAF